ncbi:DUF3139 domain-containing protein (plasmid) [Clostridium botulinum]|uniref:DUF3139 domain-containing protein n=1 Tax=Clostridium botulinum C/D str. DC5 TaxID=1443128 RepID=A0A0A0HXR8_CLOBO|nr:DUF3139 domain-containing protein [Clostridium botulinum]KEI00120.1 hypothetical protein Z952_14145 [Clostridium botulinum C/D str. BKT75002]KEI06006.1 hypothetical protein Z954_14285 [Clostridium botulinum C/D str. BKT2873]KGM93178.1 hypothetical protein Z955_15765 [Clostridium botulinum C/D str. DC5]KOC54090.1 hypothetical protein ADU90_12820 [Clostridium botulinum]KOC57117.1 hypothetical protein ADU89_00475 [Clostridium botulinum]
MKIFQKKYIFITIFILLAFNNIFLRYRIFSIGDQKEREQILSSTIWKLHKEGYDAKEIKNITVQYNALKGGLLPYEVLVVFSTNPSRAYLYSWVDVHKKGKEVERIGECASNF